MHTVSYTVFQLKQQLCNHNSVSPTKCVYVLRTGTTIEWLTVNGLRVEGKSRVQRQTVHGHLPTLNAVPVVPQRGCAVELVVKTCPRAVVHTNQNIIQSPLGRVFPYNKGDKKWKWKRNQPIKISSLIIWQFCAAFSWVSTLTLLWLPPPEHCIGGLCWRWQLDGHHLGLQEGTKIQFPQELPLDAIVGGKLDNNT